VQAYKECVELPRKAARWVNNRILSCAGAPGETDENGQSDLHVDRSELSIEPDTEVILAAYRSYFVSNAGSAAFHSIVIHRAINRMPKAKGNHTSVIIALSNIVSGVVSWALRVRDELESSPEYDVKLLCMGSSRKESPQFDVHLSSKRDVESFLRESCPAIVIPNYQWWVFDVAAKLISEGCDLKCVGYCHADSEKQYYTSLTYYAPLISQFVSVSTQCSDTLSTRLPARRPEMNVLPCGITVPKTLNRNYQTQPIRLVYAGRVVQHQKRVLDLIALVAILRQAKIPFKLTIIGEGDQLEMLRDALSVDCYHDVVRFCSPIAPAAMANELIVNDVLVQPSAFEGTSVSMLEAMAVGTVPCVTRTASGVDDIIQHGVNGWLAEIGNMNELADVIQRLATDRSALERTGMAAHTTAKQFCIESHVLKLRHILDRARSSQPPINSAQEFMKGHAVTTSRMKRVAQTAKRRFSSVLDMSPRVLVRYLRDFAQRRGSRSRKAT
jgi:glycosyltransferase involved in cell wall biosynthesis